MRVVLKLLVLDLANQSPRRLYSILPVVLGSACFQNVNQNHAWRNIGTKHGLMSNICGLGTRTANHLNAQDKKYRCEQETAITRT